MLLERNPKNHQIKKELIVKMKALEIFEEIVMKEFDIKNHQKRRKNENIKNKRIRN